jgi:NAD(P)-dependent dehydrogenase (short-subunit alcohol dehydrogenase family)
MNLELRGKRVLVTGASQGIGEGIAEVFAEEGANLLLAARNAQRLDAVADRLRAKHGVDVEVRAADLRQRDALEAVAKAAEDVDILVNNAGDQPGGDLWQLDADAWRNGWELKVMGYIDLTRLVYASMKRRGRGVIVNNIGHAGEENNPAYIAGAAGCAALMSFTRSLGNNSIKDNIRVLGINTGPVVTERMIKIMKGRAKTALGDERRYPEMMTSFPYGRGATVREVGASFAFLASPLSNYTSGVILTIDGGMTARPHY